MSATDTSKTKQEADTDPNNSGADVSSYLDSLQHQRMLSPHTITNYARDLQELLALCHAVPIELRAVKHIQIRKFAAQLHARGLNARSIARKLSAWRGF